MKTIFIVDDDTNLRRLYKAELESEGYRIILASDGHQATEMAGNENPDMVIMDIRMPEMDGIEAMARVLREHGSVPIILNTAYSCYQDNFLTWAADAYIIKSADMAPLKEMIRTILSGRRHVAASSVA